MPSQSLSAYLETRLYTSSISMDTAYKSFYASLYFSVTCLRAKISTIMDLTPLHETEFFFTDLRTSFNHLLYLL